MLCIIFTGEVSADGTSIVKASVLKYEPLPAEIGQYMDIWIKIDNTGSGIAKDVILKIEPKYPLSIDTPSNSIENIGLLPSGSSSIHKFRLYVDSNAKQGNASFDILYQENDGAAWIKNTFEVQVGTLSYDNKGNIAIDGSPKFDPEIFNPGDTGTVAITLKNLATTPSVTVKDSNYDTNAVLQGATLKGENGITVTNQNYTGNLVIGPGEAAPLFYNLNIPSNLSDGTYFLDFSIRGNSHAYNNNWRIPLVVDSSSVRIIASKPLKLENGIGKLQFDVANVRKNTISAVSVKLAAEGIEFSPSEYFIGSIGPDELYTIEVEAEDISENKNETRPLTLVAAFKNGANIHETNIASQPIKIVTVNEGNNSMIILVILILMAIAGVILYKKRKNNP